MNRFSFHRSVWQRWNTNSKSLNNKNFYLLKRLYFGSECDIIRCISVKTILFLGVGVGVSPGWVWVFLLVPPSPLPSHPSTLKNYNKKVLGYIIVYFINKKKANPSSRQLRSNFIRSNSSRITTSYHISLYMITNRMNKEVRERKMANPQRKISVVPLIPSFRFEIKSNTLSPSSRLTLHAQPLKHREMVFLHRLELHHSGVF